MRSLYLRTALLMAGGLAAQEPAVILADYMEDRSNRVFGCYCEWSSENVVSGREAILAWSFRSGSYRGTELAGTKAAAVIKGEETLSRGNPPRKTVLILDEKSSPAQRKAAEALLREAYRDLLGEIIQVYELPVDLKRTGEAASLEVAQVVNLEMRRARPEEDSMQGAVHWYDPFVQMKETTLGTTLHSQYAGGDFDHRWNWRLAGMTGYFGTVSLPLEP